MKLSAAAALAVLASAATASPTVRARQIVLDTTVNFVGAADGQYTLFFPNDGTTVEIRTLPTIHSCPDLTC